MFGSHFLDVGIGLSLFFLFVSLICSALREAFETILKSRARDLERGMRMVLDDPAGTGLTKAIFNSGQISSLMDGDYQPDRLAPSLFGAIHLPIGKARSVMPSYIPARQFAMAFLDLVGRGRGGGAPNNADAPLTTDALRAQAALLPSARLQRAMITAIDHADGDLEAVRENIEGWFNSSMDRVSGWYKRRTQVWLFSLGLVAAIVLNLDTLYVVKRLQNDDTFRQAVVASAQTVIDNGQTKTLGQTPSDARDALNGAGYPVGWKTDKDGHPVPVQFCKESADCSASSNDLGLILLIPVGWIITALATTFGAAFWFDVLNRFIVIRSTVKPAQKSGEEASADPQPSTSIPVQAVERETESVAAAPVTAPAPLKHVVFQPETWRDDFENIGEISL